MRLTARETVAIETPARRATSRMLTAAGRRLGFFRGLFTAGKIVRFLAVSQVKMRQAIFCKRSEGRDL
jgi:hypothetical protein